MEEMELRVIDDGSGTYTVIENGEIVADGLTMEQVLLYIADGEY